MLVVMSFSNISWKVKSFSSISEQYLGASISINFLKIHLKRLAMFCLLSNGFMSIDNP